VWRSDPSAQGVLEKGEVPKTLPQSMNEDGAGRDERQQKFGIVLKNDDIVPELPCCRINQFDADSIRSQRETCLINAFTVVMIKVITKRPVLRFHNNCELS
jgi:hypothetical protein